MKYEQMKATSERKGIQREGGKGAKFMVIFFSIHIEERVRKLINNKSQLNHQCKPLLHTNISQLLK